MNTNTLTKEELINRYNYLVKKHNTTCNEKKEKKIVCNVHECVTNGGSTGIPNHIITECQKLQRLVLAANQTHSHLEDKAHDQ